MILLFYEQYLRNKLNSMHKTLLYVCHSYYDACTCVTNGIHILTLSLHIQERT